MKRRFYVGSATVGGSDWTHATLAKAIEHAKTICEETSEPQIVVQIVRVVKPLPRPMKVEVVK